MRQYSRPPEKVYFFGTCLVDAVRPDAGTAAIRLLQRAGITVVYPPGQTCCGQPAYNTGFMDEARAVAKRQIALFDKDLPVVVPSGSCAGMMREHYPELFADDPALHDKAVSLSERVFELAEFLRNVLGMQPEDIGPPVTVTWHSSCHSLRETTGVADAKALIGALANVTLKELENEFECCGFGGTFSVKEPDLSGALVADKVKDVLSTGASRFITSDCGCLLNIGGVLDRKGSKVYGQHLAEFLLERTGG